MPNTRSGRDIDSALVRKGFQRFRDGDHVRYRFYEPDKNQSRHDGRHHRSQTALRNGTTTAINEKTIFGID
jgi:hypothetical protein